MSVFPIILNDLLYDLDSDIYGPSSFSNDFGLGLHPHHLRSYDAPRALRAALSLDPMSRLSHGRHRGPSALGMNKRREAMQPSPVGKDGFQVCMDVAQFRPNELEVKVVDNHVVVSGHHEEREDGHGLVQRHFVRRYAVPKDYNADKVASTLSSDGVLTVSIPKPQIEDKNSNERIIQIQQTGPAHLNVKQNPTEGAEKATNGSEGDPK